MKESSNPRNFVTTWTPEMIWLIFSDSAENFVCLFQTIHQHYQIPGRQAIETIALLFLLLDRNGHLEKPVPIN